MNHQQETERPDQSHELQSGQRRKEITQMLAQRSVVSQSSAEQAEAEYIKAREAHDAAVNMWLDHCSRCDNSITALALELELERHAKALEGVKFAAFNRWQQSTLEDQLFEAWK